jgi:hypothetical protein
VGQEHAADQNVCQTDAKDALDRDSVAVPALPSKVSFADRILEHLKQVA